MFFKTCRFRRDFVANLWFHINVSLRGGTFGVITDVRRMGRFFMKKTQCVFEDMSIPTWRGDTFGVIIDVRRMGHFL